MSRVVIPVAVLEFEEGGNTIWVQSPLGATVLRIKTMSKITTEKCTTSPVSHADIVVREPINICLGPDVEGECQSTGDSSKKAK